MLDPHTAAELTSTRSTTLVDDLLDAHGDWIPPLDGVAFDGAARAR